MTAPTLPHDSRDPLSTGDDAGSVTLVEAGPSACPTVTATSSLAPRTVCSSAIPACCRDGSCFLTVTRPKCCPCRPPKPLPDNSSCAKRRVQDFVTAICCWCVNDSSPAACAKRSHWKTSVTKAPWSPWSFMPTPISPISLRSKRAAHRCTVPNRRCSAPNLYSAISPIPHADCLWSHPRTPP